MKIKKGLKISTDDFWYDITDSGYLEPGEICQYPEDAQRVREAVETLKEFQQSCNQQIKDFSF